MDIPNIESKLNTGERKRGWGVMLIKELMDSVSFESDHTGTTVTMVKIERIMNSIVIEINGTLLILKTQGYLNKELERF